MMPHNTNDSPAEKLIQTLGAVIGVWNIPETVKKESESHPYRREKPKEAKSKELGLHVQAETEIWQRARQRLIHQEIVRQQNLDSVIKKSTKYLKKIVSDIPVDPDWTTKFFSKVQDISNDELQELWAKILAYIISNPGTISLHTLDILGNLNKKKARIFQRAAALAFNGSYILKIGDVYAFDEFGITYDDLLTLRALDLIYTSDTLNVTFNHIVHLDETPLIFGKRRFKISDDKTNITLLNQIAFSAAGKELIEALECEPDYFFLDKFIEEKTKLGFVFEDC